jgi:hypothetical protein
MACILAYEAARKPRTLRASFVAVALLAERLPVREDRHLLVDAFRLGYSAEALHLSAVACSLVEPFYSSEANMPEPPR